MARFFLRHPFLSLKPFFPKTLLGRVTLILIAPVIIVMVTTTFVFIENYWERVTRRLANDIAAEITMVSHLLQNEMVPPHQIKQLAGRHFDFKVANYPPNKHVTSPKARKSLGTSTFKKALKLHLPYPATLKMGTKEMQVQVRTSDKLLVFYIPKKRLINKTTPVFLLWQIGTPLLLLIVALVFLRNQLRPIRRLARAVDRFGKGRTVEKFKPEGAYEVRQAAIAFHHMRERIARQITQRTEMLAGISHDLRTPLTRMELQMALLEDSEAVKGLKLDVAEMRHMVDAFLDFARTQEEEKSTFVTLSTFLRTVIKRFDTKTQRIYLECPAGLKVELKPQLMQRCLSNILDNSLKYGNQVWISIHASDRWITLTVDDDGPGIPKSQQKEVFKPFYRGNKARTLDASGYGLGLAIVQDAVHLHGGKIALSESPQGGLCIRIKLPYK